MLTPQRVEQLLGGDLGVVTLHVRLRPPAVYLSYSRTVLWPPRMWRRMPPGAERP